MSLKTVHIIFIALSSICFFGYSLWLLRLFFESGSLIVFLGATASAVGSSALILYGSSFLKRWKSVTYL